MAHEILTAFKPEAWLATATIFPEITELRADYRTLLVVIGGLRPGPSAESTEPLLAGGILARLLHSHYKLAFEVQSMRRRRAQGSANADSGDSGKPSRAQRPQEPFRRLGAGSVYL